MKYDLLIKGGFLVDPSQSIEDRRDVAILGGKVAAVEEEINPRVADEVVDASGKILTPGLIDFHAHVYRDVCIESVDPDLTCLAKGVTTAVDGGSSGALNFSGFRRYVIEKCQTTI